MKISSVKQPLPVDMYLFWNSSKNKKALQMFFFKWFRDNYKGNCSVFFGGLESGRCINVVSGIENEITQLFCSTKEEADDRMVMHLMNGFTYGITSALYSCDTDVFISMMYHFKENFRLFEGGGSFLEY